jgi:hypothetical protein
MSRSLISALALALVVAAAVQGGIGVTAGDDVTLEITVVDRNGFETGGVGLSVTWDDGDGGQVNETTRSNGKALVDVPEGADVSIDIDDEDYTRNRPYTINNVDGGEITVPVSDAGRATFVVEGEGGRLDDATVEIRDAAGRIDRQPTDESGVARTDLLEQGEYTVRVTAPRHLREETTIEITNVEKNETIDLQRADVDATITVVDDHFDDPRPIEDASVRFPDLGTTLTTGEDGTGAMSVPVNSRLDVVVTKDGYGRERTRLRVEEDPVSTEVAIQRSSRVNVESVNRQVVVGESTIVTVTDEYDRPVEAATVSVGEETVGETDSQGELRVPIEAEGNVTIEARSGGNSATITVEGIEPSSEDTPTSSDETPTPERTETPGEDGAGFGVVVTALALIGAGLLGRRV